MYRIRFHGRGGQGIKTASRILGTALFVEGYRVQDAPRYGAERRGAPIFAYVRAAHDVINERGIITRPDLVLVADDSLMSIPAAGVCQGLDDRTVLLLVSRETAETWAHRLNLAGPTLVLPPMEETEDTLDLAYVGPTVAGAAACLLGIVSRESLVQAVEDELRSMAAEVRDENVATALRAYDSLEDQAGIVTEGKQLSAESFAQPKWVESLFEEARISVPAIHAGLTSMEVRTGLWRTMRPVIDYDHCNRCWWICSTFCPDNAISVNEQRYPQIDYDHCKGCMICVAKCPPHAIAAIPEHDAQEQKTSMETAP
jgi:pyruvate ferredoxin oxidoreductase gamma subunit